MLINTSARISVHNVYMAVWWYVVCYVMYNTKVGRAIYDEWTLIANSLFFSFWKNSGREGGGAQNWNFSGLGGGGGAPPCTLPPPPPPLDTGLIRQLSLVYHEHCYLSTMSVKPSIAIMYPLPTTRPGVNTSLHMFRNVSSNVSFVKYICCISICESTCL